jgi:transposase
MTPTQTAQLDRRDRPTKVPRRRTRAPRIWLAVEHGLKVAQMARIVRAREAAVRRWRTRSRAEGLAGGQEAPRPGRPSPLTEAYQAQRLAAVRRRPRR